MIARKATPGARGIDTDTTLDAAACQRLKAAGVEFVVRYVKDVRHGELAAILDAGLGFSAAGHVRPPGWSPNQGMGQLDGINVANAARALMLPSGASLWCDLEGVSPACVAADVIAYTNAWHDSVSGAGYAPGLYVGFASLLTGYQLFHALRFRSYWRSGSQVPEPVERGWQMIQQQPLDVILAGVRVDHDVIQADGFGDVPTLVFADDPSDPHITVTGEPLPAA